MCRYLPLLLALSSPTFAAETPSTAELSGGLRSVLLLNVPTPIVVQDFNWGHQEMVPIGIKWEKKGIFLKPEVMKKLHNDGVWRKIAVTADNPEKTLELTVKDVQRPDAETIRYSIEVVMPVNLKFEQQLWHSGIRLYAGETRGRCKAILLLNCESTTRVEKKPDSLLPDVVFRLRVLEAKLNYYDFAVVHTAGVGGDMAKLLGRAVHDTVNQWRPSLERNLLEKANAAIVKAGDTKEIRLGLGKLFDAKK